MTYDYKFKAAYTVSGVATSPGSAVTVDIMDVGGGSLLVTGTAASPGTSAIPGFYHCTYAGSPALDLVAVFKTDGTAVDQKHLFSYPHLAYIVDTNLDAAITTLPTANENADALLDRANGVETGHTPRQSFRLMLAALAGKLSGASTTTVTIRDVGDSKNRIVATVDSSGNRTAITEDLT